MLPSINPSHRRVLGWFIPLILLVGLYFLLAQHLSPIALSEPDRYFHLAVSRLTAENGVIRSLPQFDNLAWKEAYPNNYFLFSALGAGLYRLGGENAALLLTPLLAVTTLTLLYFAARAAVSPVHSFLLVLSVLLVPDFVNRLIVFRPLGLAMAAISFLLIGILKRSRGITGLACFLFALGYHAVYIPAFLLAAQLVCYRQEIRRSLHLLGLGVLGLSLGLLLNPVFPINLDLIWLGVKVALNPMGLEKTERPMENLPLPFSQFIFRFGFFHLVLLVSAVVGWKTWKTLAKNKQGEDQEFRAQESAFFFLLLSASAFWGLTAISLRALEYAIPVTVVLAAYLLPMLSKPVSRPIWIMALLLVQLPATFPLYYRSPHPVLDVAERFQSIEAIPKTIESHPKIFNCEWPTGPFLFYSRPDVKFVDAMDPMYLADNDQVAYSLRKLLHQGRVNYPFGVIRHLFQSDYALCEDPSVIRQLEQDPHFTRLYPKSFTGDEWKRAGTLFLYSVEKKPIDCQVFGFEFAKLPPVPRSAVAKATTPSAKEWSLVPQNLELPPEKRSPYLNLGKLEAGENPLRTEDLTCFAVRPNRDEMRSHAGADRVEFGGNALVTLWWNRQLLSQSKPRSQKQWISLPRPMHASDSLEAVVCPANPSQKSDFALSLWTKEKIEKICGARSPVPMPRQTASVPNFHNDIFIHYQAPSWCEAARSEKTNHTF